MLLAAGALLDRDQHNQKKKTSPVPHGSLFHFHVLVMACPILCVESLELVGQSLERRIRIARLIRWSWVAGTWRTQLGLCVPALLLLLSLGSLDLHGFVPACGRRKAAPDFGGDDAPAIVFVLLHGVTKLEDL